VWIQRNELPDRVQNWHGIIGKFQGSGGFDIYVVNDYRCPTLIPSGTAEPYGLSAGYMWPGSTDRRNRDNPNVRDACYLLGNGAFFHWDPEPVHNVTQPDDYDRIEGHGIAGVDGWGLVKVRPAESECNLHGILRRDGRSHGASGLLLIKSEGSLITPLIKLLQTIRKGKT